jgi:hypothetical protein
LLLFTRESSIFFKILETEDGGRSAQIRPAGERSVVREASAGHAGLRRPQPRTEVTAAYPGLACRSAAMDMVAQWSVAAVLWGEAAGKELGKERGRAACAGEGGNGGWLDRAHGCSSATGGSRVGGAR